MSAGRDRVGERELVTCCCCRRRRRPEKMSGTRCSDRDGCLRAMGRRVSAAALTDAEKAAARTRRLQGRTAAT